MNSLLKSDSPVKPKTKISDLSLVQLKVLMRSYGESKFRAKQIFRWLYKDMASSFDEMVNIPTALRNKLSSETTLLSIKPIEESVTDRGKTTKVLFELEDNHYIESVLMLYNENEKGHKRSTVCISSQAGCPIGCPFCATGQQGFERNLSPGEIVEQVLYFQRQLKNHHYDKIIGSLPPPHVTNVVFMGMGEPLLNYNSTQQALENLISAHGFGLSSRKITISTAGIVPQIKRLAKDNFHTELAISLHAGSNELRDKLVPVNQKFPLETLRPAIVEYFERTGRRPTFEYALFKGINDSPVHARELATFLGRMNCHVNLIAASPTDNDRFTPPSTQRITEFQQGLTLRGISNTLRVSRGHDVNAACGQLRSRHKLSPTAREERQQKDISRQENAK
ncbi:MAG: 23S rRNA (adenine(2503)-C(2))-methyltransferase RlmN [Dehalococcoidia bacterium]|nr:23S rRNA (adenine(2503)-C(2))-methyltransferase RlmN [Dehalococcoidia bacterium]